MSIVGSATPTNLGHAALAELVVELLGLFLMFQAGFAQFARIRV
jgi:hypothetical protein